MWRLTLARDWQMTEGKDDKYQKDRQRDKEEHRNWNKREMRPTLGKTAGENGKQNFLT